MSSRPTSHTLHTSQRAITVVLALWLCVLAAGVWAPVARAHMAAQGLERLCSSEESVQWVPSPFSHSAHDDALGQMLHHQLDCPLCMPTLAPPGEAQLQLPQHAPAQAPAVYALPWPGQLALYWPLARGPPL